jgi:hypothetical protein
MISNNRKYGIYVNHKQKNIKHGKHKTYPRVMNTTDIQFTQEEIKLLSQGLKYNLYYRQKNWLETLALDAETAINKLNIKNNSILDIQSQKQ